MPTAKPLHWTQTPEGRQRMAILARKARKARGARQKPHWTQTPQGRARIGAMTRARHAERATIERAIAASNGQSSTTARVLTKADITALAKAGARVRIVDLEYELTALRIFVGDD